MCSSDLGQALLNLRLNEDRPVAMLADDVSLRMGAMYVGIPYVLIEASQLEHATELLTPGLVVTSEVPKAVATPAQSRPRCCCPMAACSRVAGARQARRTT